MIYTFFSPFGNKLPKSSQKMHSAKRLSGLVFMTKASVEVAGAGGVATGAGGTEAVAGADDVALVSGTGTVADL